MPTQKKFDPSWNFSAAILGIGAVSLVCVLLFSHAMEGVRIKVNAAEQTSSGWLEMCMRSAEKKVECYACVSSDALITSASCQACAAVKALCQNEYNACTDEGGNIHAW